MPKGYQLPATLSWSQMPSDVTGPQVDSSVQPRSGASDRPLTILLMQPSPEIYIRLAAAALQASSCVPSVIQYLANIPLPRACVRLGVSGCLMLRPASRNSHPVQSASVRLTHSADVYCHMPGQIAVGHSGRRQARCAGLVEGGEFQTAFIGKKMLEPGLEGSEGNSPRRESNDIPQRGTA